jgi:hypothetical protein
MWWPPAFITKIWLSGHVPQALFANAIRSPLGDQSPAPAWTLSGVSCRAFFPLVLITHSELVSSSAVWPNRILSPSGEYRGWLSNPGSEVSVFHRLEHRIRAHVVVCWLALLLIRIAERATNQSWRRVATELQRLHLVTLQGCGGSVRQITRPTDPQSAILAALEIATPPRITALEPA